jgi:hypothetical protein
MSWSEKDVTRRNFVKTGLAGLTLLASGPLLNACGWKPVYGNASTTPSGNATVDANLAAIKIQPPTWKRDPSPYEAGGGAKYDARTSQILHNALRDGLNPYGQPSTPAYELEIRLNEYISPTITANSGDTRREDLRLDADFKLTNAKGSELLGETTRAVLAYSLLQEPYQDLIARNDARERAARQLAELIKLRLSAYFAAHG